MGWTVATSSSPTRECAAYTRDPFWSSASYSKRLCQLGRLEPLPGGALHIFWWPVAISGLGWLIPRHTSAILVFRNKRS